MGRVAEGAVQADGALRAHGLRATPARQVLLAVLGELGHATPEELYAAAAPRLPGLNLSTVYRTLDSLADSALVSHAHFHGTVRSYFLAEHADHGHLVCERCDAIVSLDDPAFRQLLGDIATAHGYVVDPAHVTLVGRCAACRDEQSSG